MAIATPTVSKNVCTIETPTNLDSIILIPQASGAAAWTNYCIWEMETATGELVTLGEWSAQQQNISIVDNPDQLISTPNLRGTISRNTHPSVSGADKTVLTFAHTVNGNSERKPNDLKVFSNKVTDKITYISVLSEDGGGQNYLDFFMTVILTEK